MPLQAVQVRCATVVLAHRSERGARTVLARAADQDGRQESACAARAARRGERLGEGVRGGAGVLVRGRGAGRGSGRGGGGGKFRYPKVPW